MKCFRRGKLSGSKQLRLETHNNTVRAGKCHPSKAAKKRSRLNWVDYFCVRNNAKEDYFNSILLFSFLFVENGVPSEVLGEISIECKWPGSDLWSKHATSPFLFNLYAAARWPSNAALSQLSVSDYEA